MEFEDIDLDAMCSINWIFDCSPEKYCPIDLADHDESDFLDDVFAISDMKMGSNGAVEFNYSYKNCLSIHPHSDFLDEFIDLPLLMDRPGYVDRDISMDILDIGDIDGI